MGTSSNRSESACSVAATRSAAERSAEAPWTESTSRVAATQIAAKAPWTQAALRSAPLRGYTRSGLTLVELLVVLLILVILTTIAVQSTDNLILQSRYDATQQSLQNIQNAIVGSTNQRAPGGGLIITGFVADMGRLPQPVDTTSDPLRELWDTTVIPSTSLFSLQLVPLNLWYLPNTPMNATSNTVQATVQLQYGWRGPYIQPPLASKLTSTNGQAQIQLLDGWGNPFDALTLSGTLATPGGSPNQSAISLVRSRGANYVIDANPLTLPVPTYSQNLYIPAQNYQTNGSSLALPSPLATFSTIGNVQVTVLSFNSNSSNNNVPTLGPPTAIGSSDYIRIVLFMPVNGILTPVLAVNPATNQIDYQLSQSATAGTPVIYAFPNVPIGTRAVQAFQIDTSIPSQIVIRKRSPLTVLSVPTGGPPPVTLVIQ
jgi:prepilin-type N-terminal cleavage/methylation domain-containing protein